MAAPANHPHPPHYPTPLTTWTPLSAEQIIAITLPVLFLAARAVDPTVLSLDRLGLQPHVMPIPWPQPPSAADAVVSGAVVPERGGAPAPFWMHHAATGPADSGAGSAGEELRGPGGPGLVDAGAGAGERGGDERGVGQVRAGGYGGGEVGAAGAGERGGDEQGEGQVTDGGYDWGEVLAAKERFRAEWGGGPRACNSLKDVGTKGARSGSRDGM
ncbi:hypothetical protein MMC11_003053 [Xylographa trunciseda]|nr:hypothetical protein [Xylographa trunciseda]